MSASSVNSPVSMITLVLLRWALFVLLSSAVLSLMTGSPDMLSVKPAQIPPLLLAVLPVMLPPVMVNLLMDSPLSSAAYTPPPVAASLLVMLPLVISNVPRFMHTPPPEPEKPVVLLLLISPPFMVRVPYSPINTPPPWPLSPVLSPSAVLPVIFALPDRASVLL